MYLWPKFHLSGLFFIFTLCENEENMQAAQKLIVWRDIVPEQHYQTPNISDRVVGNWLGTFGGQFSQILVSELLKMELTLWEDISKMR